MSKEERLERARELVRLVGIPERLLFAYPHQLSGGMRQRIMIAMALALRPEIVIMDEPTTALDVVVQREILTRMSELRAELGFSVVFITHDLSRLLELADTIAVMYAGKIVEQAPADDLYRMPLHPYSEGLLGSFPSLVGPRVELVGLAGSPPDLRRVPPGCTYHERCQLAQEVCRREIPPLVSSGARSVACHFRSPDQEPTSFSERAAAGGSDA
jgi:peptide/nickel transport system ATP-binding protein